MSYHAGLAAEEIVARHYVGIGGRIMARRWRGRGGEIDVIVEIPGETVFVEVKKSATHAAAALRVTDQQVRRLFDCAGEFMGTLPDGLNAQVRFDVALVDEVGRVEIVENALSS
jgi:putative endonuclease